MAADTKKTPVGSAVELVGILVVAIGLALLIQAFLVKPFQIPSESMVPTLKVGQRVLVNRLGENFGEPHIGDILVFHPPEGAKDDQPGGDAARCGAVAKSGEACSVAMKGQLKVNFIKRVVAGPGDTIAVVGSHVILNGKRQEEPFVQATCATGIDTDFPKPIRIPAGHWYMMGDNRQCSEDSRYWGPITKSEIIGGAFATYWPPKRIGTL